MWELNMNDDVINFWLEVSDTIALNVENAIKNAASDPEINTITKMGADGTPTHKIDEYAENAAIKTLESTGHSLILISEEIGTIKIGDDDPEIILIMDPLDGTTNALNKFHVMVFLLPLLKLRKIRILTILLLEILKLDLLKILLMKIHT